MVDIIRKYSPVPLTPEQVDLMQKVADRLAEKNKVVNLTAITDENQTAELHFIDSIYPVSTGRISGRVLDVGSGGGFPGIPVAIATGLNVTCLDATRKKLDFIDETASALGLVNIHTLCGRAEELAQDKKHREKYDTVLSRGVARLNVLCEWCIPYVKLNGCFIAMKGSNAGEEVAEAENAIKTLGGELVDIIQYKLELSGHVHSLVIIKKVKPTPTVYPRRNSQIMKKPL